MANQNQHQTGDVWSQSFSKRVWTWKHQDMTQIFGTSRHIVDQQLWSMVSYYYWTVYLVVSWNRGTPKSSILMGFSQQTIHFCGTSMATPILAQDVDHCWPTDWFGIQLQAWHRGSACRVLALLVGLCDLWQAERKIPRGFRRCSKWAKLVKISSLTILWLLVMK